MPTPVGVWSSHPARSRSTSSPGVAGRRAGSIDRPGPQRRFEPRGDVARRRRPTRQRTVGASPVSSAKAVAARLNTSLARSAGAPAATSGARNPACPPLGCGVIGTDDEPRSTTTTRPVPSRIRLAGLTSPWTTPCWCSTVSASAAWAIHRSTLETGRPGRPSSASRRAEVDALDPVEHEHVPAVVEEVVAGVGQPGVRWQRQQRAGLDEQLVGGPSAGTRTHLQRDEALVARVDRLEHGRLAAAAEHLHRLVAIGDPSAQPSAASEVGERDDTGVERGVGEAGAPPFGAVDAELRRPGWRGAA